MRIPEILNGKRTRIHTKKVVESSYGEFDTRLWHETAAVRGCGRGWPGSREAQEWPRNTRHHACAGRQQGRYRKAIAYQPGSILRSLPRDLTLENRRLGRSLSLSPVLPLRQPYNSESSLVRQNRWNGPTQNCGAD